MKKIFFLVLLVVHSFFAKSQAYYTIQSIPYSHDPYNAGVDINPTFVDDIFFSVIPIGFTFNYFGNNYDSLVVSTNGSVSFNTSLANTHCGWAISGITIPYSSNELNNSILAPFQDLDAGIANPTSSIRVALYGTAPNRRFVISFDSIPIFSCTTLINTSQIILYETTNVIDINIENKPVCAGWNTGAAILGIQNANGTFAYTPPGRNGTQWTATNESWRFTPTNDFEKICKIKGNVFFDINNNCVLDPNEKWIINQLVSANNGKYSTRINTFGEYTLTVPDTGAYTITYEPTEYIYRLCPQESSYKVIFTKRLDSVMNINFGDSSRNCIDVYSTIGLDNIHQGDTSHVTVKYGNTGIYFASDVIVKVKIPYCFNIFNVKGPYQYNYDYKDNSYSFNISQLLPGYTGYINFDLLNDNCYQSFKDSTLLFYSNIDFLKTFDDCNMSNNSDIFYQKLTNTNNSKEAFVSSRIEDGFSAIGEVKAKDWITYKLNFHYTDSNYIPSVLIEDIIDTNYLDIQAVEFNGASHFCTLSKESNRLLFRLDSISLPYTRTSQFNNSAWLKFKIRTKRNLPDNAKIENKCTFYYDNKSYVSNTQLLYVKNPTILFKHHYDELVVYPNPMKDYTILDFKYYRSLTHLRIFNIYGQKVFSDTFEGIYYVLYRHSLISGVYFIQALDNDGNYSFSKLLIE
jgi:hypothetical protein